MVESILESKKRRKRVPLACTVCRKRKIKCDRNRPACGGCTRNDTVDDCFYEDPCWLEDVGEGESSHYKAAIHPIGILAFNNNRRHNNDEKGPSVKLGNKKRGNSNGSNGSASSNKKSDSKKPDGVYGGNSGVNANPGTIQTSQVGRDNEPLVTSLPSNNNSESTNYRPNTGSPLEIPNSHLNRFRVGTPTDSAQLSNVLQPNSGTRELCPDPYNASKSHLYSRLVNFGSLKEQPSMRNSLLVTPMTTATEASQSLSSLTSALLVQDGSNLKVDFYSGMVSIRYRKPKLKINNLGPLSGASFLQKDFYGRILFNSVLRFKKLNTKNNHDMKAFKKQRKIMMKIGDGNGDLYFSSRSRGQNFMLNSVKERKSIKNLEVKIKDYNKMKISEEEIDTEMAKELSSILPKKDIIYMYVDRFFKYVYPFYPLLDEESFRDTLPGLIGALDSNEVKVDLSDKLKHFDMALLLLVLKLSFLSVYSYRLSPRVAEAEDVKTLLEHPIGTHYLTYIKVCLNKFNFLRKTGLGLVQALYYLRVYHSVGFEENDGAGNAESNIFSGVIYQSANFIGLNRDPVDNMLNFSDSEMNSRTLQLWRKTWFTLVDLDTEQAMNSNAVPSLNPNFSDTKYPDYQRIVEGSNCRDLNVEKGVIDHIINKYQLNLVIKRILDKIMNISSPPTIGELNVDLQSVQQYLNRNFMSYAALIEDYQNRKKMKLNKYDAAAACDLMRKFKVSMSLAEFVFTVKYHIYLELESHGSMYATEAWKHYTDLFQLTIEMILIAKFWLVHGSNYITDFHSYQYLISSHGIGAFHKFGQFYCSFLIRIVSSKYRLAKVQLSRVKTLESVEFLYKLFLKGTDYLAAVCYIFDSYSDDFYASHRSKAILRYCLRSITDQSADNETSINNLFKKGLQDEEFYKNLFHENSQSFHSPKFKSLLELFERYEILNKSLENENVAVGNAKAGEPQNGKAANMQKGSSLSVPTQRTSYTRSSGADSIPNPRTSNTMNTLTNFNNNYIEGVALAFSNPPIGALDALATPGSEFYIGMGPLSLEDIENYWKALEGNRAPEPQKDYMQPQISSQIDLPQGSNSTSYNIAANLSSRAPDNRVNSGNEDNTDSSINFGYSSQRGMVNNLNFGTLQGTPNPVNSGSGINASDQNYGINLDSLNVPDINDTTFVDDILGLNDELLDVFGISDNNLDSFFPM